MLALLQVKSMEPSEHVTMSSPPINSVPGPPSARLVEKSSAVVQNTPGVMPKASNRAGAGVAVKGVKAAKAGEAAPSRGVGCTPGGTSKAKSAAKGLAPATPATRPKQGEKAEPKKSVVAVVTSKQPTTAGADAEAAIPQGDQDLQEVQGRGRVIRGRIMVHAPHLVQFVSPKKIAHVSQHIHCNGLYVPKHVIDWYPGIQHGSPLHLQLKVPAAAEELLEPSTNTGPLHRVENCMHAKGELLLKKPQNRCGRSLCIAASAVSREVADRIESACLPGWTGN